MSEFKLNTRVYHDKQETERQAKTWEDNKNWALKKNMCIKCSSQFAWGKQLGFHRTTAPPCTNCEPIVALFKTEVKNGWRTPTERARTRRVVPV